MSIHKHFGKVLHKTTKVFLQEDAYLTKNKNSMGHEYDCYRAVGMDDKENEYEILWDIIEGFDINSEEDQSSACDWDKYTISKF